MPRILFILGTLVWLAGAAIALAQDQDSDRSYTVRYGDVLDIIAASVDMSAQCIAELSGLENPNKMRPGDVLVFSPSCPPYDGLIPIQRETSAGDQGGGGRASAQTTGSGDYVVRRGDVLDAIAAAFDVSVRCLAQANGLTNPGMIYVGDELTIDLNCPPYDGVDFVLNPRAEAQLQQGGGGGAVYMVRVGDTLDKIGARFDLSPKCLGESNGLENPGRIFPGDEIALDPNCPVYDGLALQLQGR